MLLIFLVLVLVFLKGVKRLSSLFNTIRNYFRMEIVRVVGLELLIHKGFSRL